MNITSAAAETEIETTPIVPAVAKANATLTPVTIVDDEEDDDETQDDEFSISPDPFWRDFETITLA
mgnify:FL=1